MTGDNFVKWINFERKTIDRAHFVQFIIFRIVRGEFSIKLNILKSIRVKCVNLSFKPESPNFQRHDFHGQVSRSDAEFCLPMVEYIRIGVPGRKYNQLGRMLAQIHCSQCTSRPSPVAVCTHSKSFNHQKASILKFLPLNPARDPIEHAHKCVSPLKMFPCNQSLPIFARPDPSGKWVLSW